MVLKESKAKIEGAVISENASSMTRNAGKYIVSPGGVEAKMLDSYGILKSSPLINVKGDKISITGKAESDIYFNGRKPEMEKQAVSRSMPHLYHVPECSGTSAATVTESKA